MSKKITILTAVSALIITTALVYLSARAGELNPSAAPGDTMRSLEDIYCKITNCATSTYGIDSPGEASSTMYTLEEIYDVAFGNYYGKGWVASTTGDNATTSLTQATCEAAENWEWFEDANGDGDTIDPEDGICVMSTTTYSSLGSWNGYDYTTNADNSYIAAYECEGSFPNGTVATGTYNGLVAGPTADIHWDNGDCALCQADCYDGRRDLPAQGSYTSNAGGTGGYQGPITPEILKAWKGTRLPTANDFYGFCGYKDGGSNYETGCSSDTTHGDSGQMVGRTDECLDLSNSTAYEWLSEQHYSVNARIAGNNACSYHYSSSVYSGYRFRSVFRP